MGLEGRKDSIAEVYTSLAIIQKFMDENEGSITKESVDEELKRRSICKLNAYEHRDEICRDSFNLPHGCYDCSFTLKDTEDIKRSIFINTGHAGSMPWFCAELLYMLRNIVSNRMEGVYEDEFHTVYYPITKFFNGRHMYTEELKEEYKKLYMDIYYFFEKNKLL